MERYNRQTTGEDFPHLRALSHGAELTARLLMEDRMREAARYHIACAAPQPPHRARVLLCALGGSLIRLGERFSSPLPQ